MNPYSNSFAQTTVKMVMKGLRALWVLTGDIELGIYVEMMKKHFDKKMAEADREKRFGNRTTRRITE